MPSALPLADPAPADGLLPASAADGAADRTLSVYLHVPFCRVRCGYCDFNTYTAGELRGVSQRDYPDHAIAEVAFADQVLRSSGVPARPVSTVFFGGGTPTLLPADDLARMLGAVRGTWGLVPGAEVTVEANPDSVTAESLQVLANAGVTRVSFGMQSAVPSVLAVLDRTHDPARVPLAVQWAKDAGLNVSVDLIYGSPGETVADWERSLDAAIAMAPDHVSAYSLIVEPGTAMARRIARGELPEPDEDLHATFYELADDRLAAAGFHWYEVSNWARSEQQRSQHNLAYWRSQDWWGIGPGAHSHIGGVRWWNAKHPAAYAERVLGGVSPAVGRETLDAETQLLERVLLEVRIADGMPVTVLPEAARTRVAGLIADGLVVGPAAVRGQLVLTRRGRLQADAVVRALID